MKPFYVRELSQYPTGRRRVRLLAMAVLASLLISYEGQLAPVLPLLLDDLEMTLQTYGLISAAAVVLGAITALYGGRLSDRHGRVTILVPTLILTSFACYSFVFVESPRGLLITRCALAFIEGAAITTTAGLVRDFAPRVGRAMAFGFWTWGPVGANFLAAAIASVTLPIFDYEWRSQFVIMGTVALIGAVVFALCIADISPGLRASVIKDADEMASRGEVRDDVRAGSMRTLLRHPHMWAHVVSITLWLVFYYTLVLFGTEMLEESFGMNAAQAAGVMASFWVLNLGCLIVAGWVSDRLQVRRTVSLVGAVASLVMMAYFISLVGRDVSIGHVVITGAVLAACMGVSYAPWMACFSENAEDIDPSLQGTAWGLWGSSARVMIVVSLLVLPLVVAAGGWITWLVIALVCNAVYIPALLMFKGPWRPTRSLSAELDLVGAEPTPDTELPGTDTAAPTDPEADAGPRPRV